MIVDNEPTRSGHVVYEGQRLAWQEFGAGEDVVLLLPTWSIVHSDFWRHQVPFLAGRYRVIAYDGLGNGGSDRPLDPSLYGDVTFADHAVAVMDGLGVERAAVMGVSQGGAWALALAGRHPERVSAAVFVVPNVPLSPGHAERVAGSQTFDDILDSHVGWACLNRHYWLERYPDFLRYFFAQCFTEPDSSSQIQHFFDMGMQTTPDVLLATVATGATELTADAAADFARGLHCASLVIHGDEDAITPLACGVELARLAGSELVVMAGSGHEPQCRVPETVNPIMGEFLESVLDGGRT